MIVLPTVNCDISRVGRDEQTVEQTLSCAAPRIDHGVILRHGIPEYQLGTFVDIECEVGYELQYDGRVEKSVRLECGENGSWHTQQLNHQPQCIEMGCYPPPTVQHTAVNLLLHNGSVLATAEDRMAPYTRVHYTCLSGWQLVIQGQDEMVCMHGRWSGDEPQCTVRTSRHGTCGYLPPLEHSKVYFKLYSSASMSGRDDIRQEDYPDGMVPDGVVAYFQCGAGYSLRGSSARVCHDAVWTGTQPLCLPVSLTGCPPPPNIQFGDNSYKGNIHMALSFGLSELPDQSHVVAEGTQVIYFCHNGYELADERDADRLVCRGGSWTHDAGSTPQCVTRKHCDVPLDIENGNWDHEGSHQYFDGRFWIGTAIIYTCNAHFVLAGTSSLQCESSGYWSDNPPACLPKEGYCNKPAEVDNGNYACIPECGMFAVGVQIHYMCAEGYQSHHSIHDTSTCLPGGLWSPQNTPQCNPVAATSRSSEMLSGLNISTVTVVIATSCSILGLLVVVILIVAIQRRRACLLAGLPQAPLPPTYPSQHFMDDHDRVSLTAFAEGYQAHLPTYEEAMCQASIAGVGFNRRRDPNPLSAIHGPAGSYRQLPMIPANLRTRLETPRSPPGVIAMGPSTRNDSHRHSIITLASTTTHDNMSMAFGGSVDTMNIGDGVSTHTAGTMSNDGTCSTTITIDTIDSGATSLVLSQCALAGSIASASSSASLADDVVPLLDENEDSEKIV